MRTEHYGVPVRSHAGIYLHQTDNVCRWACCTVAWMSSGIKFIDYADIIVWEGLVPDIPVRWVLHLQRTGTAPSKEELNDVDLSIDPLTSSYPIQAVGYPKALKEYYRIVRPNWKEVDLPLNNFTLSTMPFHRERMYKSSLKRASLQFAHSSKHHELVYATPAIQSSISCALLAQTAQHQSYHLQTTEMNITSPSSRESRRVKVNASSWIATA